MASVSSAQPPLEGLRHAMWALAAGHHNELLHLQDAFYRSARRGLQEDETQDEGALTLSHCQAWLLITVYEFKFLKMSRAWLSTGRAVRIAQAIGIDRLEGISSGTLARSPASADSTVTDREVRRRTFWMVFWADRCCSMGAGWPVAIDEATIATGLPDFEDAFQHGHLKSTPSFDDVLNARTRQFSPLAASITVLGLHGRTLGHLQRPLNVAERNDFSSAFWQRHREIGDLHSSFYLNLPSHLRLSQASLDPTIVYAHLAFNTSLICLQQSAVLHASEAQPSIPQDFIDRCRLKSLSAATEIASIMRISSAIDLRTVSLQSTTSFPRTGRAGGYANHLGCGKPPSDIERC